MKFMQIEPQPARGKLVKSMWDDPNWIAEEKYDGDRRIAQFCGKVVRFTGRRQSVTDGLYVEKTANIPHLSNHYPGVKLASDVPCHLFNKTKLEGTVLDGEMIYPVEAGGVFDASGKRVGGLSKHVTSIMGSLPEEAIKKQLERGWLHYVVFDCLFYKGRDVRGMRLLDRNEFMCEAVTEWGNPFAVVAPNAINKNKVRFYTSVLARGGEGVILKHLDHRYGDKNGWVKVKKCATYDVVIIGFKAAKETSRKVDGTVSRTKYAGKVGSVEIAQYANDYPCSMGYARGFSDRLMEEFTRHPKKYLGRVITIEANDREPTGKFRHPRVTDPVNPFRDDKKAKDCIYYPEEC